ncbi:hypothetical protein PR202_ga26080 [Eleusine coracana subsp. coracana]|uniref:Uncharacterized protein n=1 Tax=Eleusine coracana subsp. coracana TaxID=191504 RepID=A0AAV5DD67_ELECO|nr:hypothetical protein PR202_ga26080 [Eleusine coracana subsp. coracana]
MPPIPSVEQRRPTLAREEQRLELRWGRRGRSVPPLPPFDLAAMHCLHCKPIFHHFVHRLVILRQNQVTARRSMAGTLYYCMQPYISVHLAKVVSAPACHPSEQTSLTMKIQQQSNFFNWFTFGNSIGGLLGLILIVWLENYKGWDIGLGFCSILILLGLLVFAAGLPFYRNQVPEGSPLTRILQVLVVSFRNRKLELPEKLEEAQESSAGPATIEDLRGKNSLKFLDKACINPGKDGAWSHCSAVKVEETKIVLRLLPLFLSSMIGYVSNPILLTFTVQQGGMTNTRLGKIHVSPATLFIIPITFQTVMLALYDRFIVPFLRRRTGYTGGITHLQRISIGFMSMILASVIAALVERKRKETAVQMSLFWLTPQFFLLASVRCDFVPRAPRVLQQ